MRPAVCVHKRMVEWLLPPIGKPVNLHGLQEGAMLGQQLAVVNTIAAMHSSNKYLRRADMLMPHAKPDEGCTPSYLGRCFND